MVWSAALSSVTGRSLGGRVDDSASSPSPRALLENLKFIRKIPFKSHPRLKPPLARKSAENKKFFN